MKEVYVTDTTKQALEASGVSLHTWILERLQERGFDLHRPVQYQYQGHLSQTRIYQYEHAPDTPPAHQNIDADFLDEAGWEAVFQLLVAE